MREGWVSYALLAGRPGVDVPSGRQRRSPAALLPNKRPWSIRSFASIHIVKHELCSKHRVGYCAQPCLKTLAPAAAQAPRCPHAITLGPSGANSQPRSRPICQRPRSSWRWSAQFLKPPLLQSMPAPALSPPRVTLRAGNGPRSGRGPPCSGQVKEVHRRPGCSRRVGRSGRCGISTSGRCWQREE